MKRFMLVLLIVAVMLSLISVLFAVDVYAEKGGNGKGNDANEGHAPDQDGKGADKGEQDNDGRGPVDIPPDADADKNNGSGNDEDCEDDNNGNGPKCQPKPPEPPVTPTPEPPVVVPPTVPDVPTVPTPEPPVITDGPFTGRVCCVPGKGSVCELFTEADYMTYSSDPSALEELVLAEDNKSFCKDVPAGKYVLLFWRTAGHKYSPHVGVTVTVGNTKWVYEPRATVPSKHTAR